MLQKECLVCSLGCLRYPDAVALQERLLEERFRGNSDDVVLLAEHPPTITLGKHARPENILLSDAELDGAGIEVCDSGRGGDVTFHCPGQILIYPIMDLRERPGLVRGYIHDLEEVALRLLSGYSIKTERWEEHPGLWAGGKQIAAIGLQLASGISMHGMSLNVHPDLERFKIINLCGVAGLSATSMEKETGRYDIAIDEVAANLLRIFADVFGVDMHLTIKEELFGGRVEPAIAAVV